MNIQALPILIDESGNWQGGDLLPFDLQCNDGTNDINKIITGVYATIVGHVITEVSSPLPKNAKYITKITNQCDEVVSYHLTDPGPVIDLLTYSCPHCNSNELGELKTYVKQFNIDNADVGNNELADPLFKLIPIDVNTELHAVDVIIDMVQLYENALYNWFRISGDTIFLHQPITDGVQVMVKFNY